jgi:ubiquinone/menaquinone biosynthesis C-methylase UbiE
MLTKLVCPACRVEIIRAGTDWQCPRCEKTYSYLGGILSFLTEAERFNEGDFQEKQKNAWSSYAQMRLAIRRNRLLSILNTLRVKFSLSGRRDRLFYNEMKGGDKSRLILDLGCGGGRHYFCDYGTVIGVDPVLELLPMAKSLYAEVYHAGGYNLPFADNTFDYLVSSDVLGHIPFDKKDQLFAEMFRVLKRGGRTVHLIETDSTAPWFRYAKRDPAFFQLYFIDRLGHIGLETPTALRNRFLKHGFREVLFKKTSSNIQELGTISSVFTHRLKERSAGMRALIAVDKLLGRNLLIREALHLLMEPMAILDDWLTPVDYGCSMLVVFEK